MRNYLVLLLFVVLGGVSEVYAQSTEATFKRANQQYVLLKANATRALM